MNEPVDPYAVPDHLADRFLKVQRMAEAMAASGAGFFVILTKYVIEGEEYLASGLTVSPTATPNLVQTQTGFACDATFPPQLLSEKSRRGKKARRGGITVRLEARLDDVIDILPIGQ